MRNKLLTCRWGCLGGLLVMLWLLSGQQGVVAQTPFRVTDYMMSGNYRYPDKEPYTLRHWWQGLSLSTYWSPKMLNFQTDYDGFELKSAGLALTKDFNKSSALRLGIEYAHKERLELSADYVWNLSNYWLGYNPRRRVEWLATTGLLGGITDFDGGHRKFYGGRVGLQLRHTLSPYVSFYIEPQYQATSPLYDHQWEHGNIVDDGLALQVGLITRLTGPWRQDSYGGAVGNALKTAGQWTAQHILLGNGLRFDKEKALHRWYVELLGGTQLRVGSHRLDELSLYEGGFETNLGMRLNSVLALQVGAFAQRLDLSQWSDSPERIYGYRAELSVDPLRFFWHKSEERGWAWTVGGGLEGGRVELWDHVPGLSMLRYIEPTAHTQLRRRLFGQTWLVLQGRWQCVDVDGDDLQLTAFAGLHYNLVAPRRAHRRVPTWWKGLWVAGAWGAWDMTNSLVNATIGYDFNDTHTLRIDYAYSHLDSHNALVKKTYLNLFSIDYMMNLRNAFVGHDANRRFHAYMMAGYNLAVHPEFDTSLWHAHSYVGMEGGARLELRLSRHLSLYVEEKTLFVPGNAFLSPDVTQGFSMMGMAGLRVSLW